MYSTIVVDKIAWLFPGQGSQKVGMGRDVAEASEAARQVFQAVDARLEPAIGRSLSALCFDGPEDDLRLTAFTQPALVVTSIAILAAARERFADLGTPAFGAGHSLGEYSALVAAGAMKVEDACWVVHLRGKAMQEAVPAGTGAMSAIMGVERADLEQMCADAEAATSSPVSIANLNAPAQIVISGAAAAVAVVNETASAVEGSRVVELKVSAPFHCALMKPAADKVAAALEEIEISPAAFPVVSNFDAVPRTDPAGIKDALIKQVDSPVLWQTSMERLSTEGVTKGLEIGAGKVLRGLMRKNAKHVKIQNVLNLATLDKLGAFLSD